MFFLYAKQKLYAMERKHFAHFTIAGFTYYDGCIAFNKLKIGKKLLLKTEPRNKYDDHAVAIYYKDLKLGFIPREYNKHVITSYSIHYTKLYDIK